MRDKIVPILFTFLPLLSLLDVNADGIWDSPKSGNWPKPKPPCEDGEENCHWPIPLPKPLPKPWPKPPKPPCKHGEENCPWPIPFPIPLPKPWPKPWPKPPKPPCEDGKEDCHWPIPLPKPWPKPPCKSGDCPEPEPPKTPHTPNPQPNVQCPYNSLLWDDVANEDETCEDFDCSYCDELIKKCHCSPNCKLCSSIVLSVCEQILEECGPCESTIPCRDFDCNTCAKRDFNGCAKQTSNAPHTNVQTPSVRTTENTYPETETTENTYPETETTENTYPETETTENTYQETTTNPLVTVSPRVPCSHNCSGYCTSPVFVCKCPCQCGFTETMVMPCDLYEVCPSYCDKMMISCCCEHSKTISAADKIPSDCKCEEYGMLELPNYKHKKPLEYKRIKPHGKKSGKVPRDKHGHVLCNESYTVPYDQCVCDDDEAGVCHAKSTGHGDNCDRPGCYKRQISCYCPSLNSDISAMKCSAKKLSEKYKKPRHKDDKKKYGNENHKHKGDDK